MSLFKRCLVCLIFFVDYTITAPSENSAINSTDELINRNITKSNGTSYWQTMLNCANKKQSNGWTYCVFKQSLTQLDKVIANNETWQLSDYVSLRKNANWKPLEFERRSIQTPYGQIVRRLCDLVMSRTVKFSIPSNDDENGNDDVDGVVDEQQRQGRFFNSENVDNAVTGRLIDDRSIVHRN